MQIHVNYPAVAAAVIASFVFAWLWHGPLFGKIWAPLMNVPADAKPEPKMMVRSMGLQILGTFLTAYVLVFTGEVWRPSVWGAGADQPSYFYGFFNGFWIWLGVFAPILLGAGALANRALHLLRLNPPFHFVHLPILALAPPFFPR